MKIGIDIDDTISITWDEILPEMMKFYKLELKDVAYNKGEYYRALGISMDEFHEHEKKYHQEILQNLKVKNNCISVLKNLKENGNEIVLITARSNAIYDDPFKFTESWLKKVGVPYDKLVVSAFDKKMVCQNENIDVFIDDSEYNCRSVSELGIPVYLMNSKFNQKVTDLNRVHNWLEIESCLEKLR